MGDKGIYVVASLLISIFVPAHSLYFFFFIPYRPYSNPSPPYYFRHYPPSAPAGGAGAGAGACACAGAGAEAGAGAGAASGAAAGGGAAAVAVAAAFPSFCPPPTCLLWLSTHKSTVRVKPALIRLLQPPLFLFHRIRIHQL